MRLFLGTWCNIYTVICLIIFVIIEGYFIKKAYENNKFAIVAIPLFSGFAFVVFAISVFVMFESGGTNISGSVGHKVNMNVTSCEISSFYDLKEIKETLNNAYDNKFTDLDLYDYYYDSIEVVLDKKPLSFLELISYAKKHDYNMIYSSKSKVTKFTKKIELDGILTPQVDSISSIKYLIDEYTLEKIGDKSIDSLPNNQNIKLNIIYNERNYEGDKCLKDYVITDAKTDHSTNP